MLARIITATTGVSVIMLLILFFTTTPATAGPIGILGFFVFMYLAALGVLTFLFRIGGILFSKIIPREQARSKARDITLRKSYYYSSVLASVPVMLIAIQSVGEIGVSQVLLILFFAVIAWIYVSNRVT